MTVNELMEKKIENLIKAIKRDLIGKNEASKYRNEHAKVLY